MGKMVTLKIDNQTVNVPQGTLVVDAAKMAGIDIPVFCYHPKLKPVGMCRMCLVEIGRPVIDRATGAPQLELDGTPKMQFGPKLETSCTVPVSDGMWVRTDTANVTTARKDVVEFILTSHPLDCPVCDKGGECPLQNLTMRFGSDKGRFLFDEKMHLEKHVPLGDLIWLDRERCIQCGRCIRFAHDVAGDPVIHFFHRGRHTDIITDSEPGFDSIFSGNTTDICPVGALTTADFRFGARPWEMKAAASICNQCPVGCNIDYSVRREAKSGGRTVIKRAMPRQNEAVNELWMCDKGRFGYHFAESPARIRQPLVRVDGKLVPASWEEALERVATAMRGASLVTLAGGHLSNEALFNLRELTAAQGGKALLHTPMGGGDLVAQVGMAPGSNLGDLGKGAAILVIASDLHEEAPIWWLRVKQAAERGAALIVAAARPTRLEAYATQVIRYAYGEETDALQKAAQALPEVQDLVIFYGSDGLGLAETTALAARCADLLVRTQHTGRANNGLIPVWPAANTQGAWDLGFRPADDLAAALRGAGMVYAAAADPAGDDPALAEALDAAGFVVAQELFMTETARRADVVLPAQAYTEGEGTFTSGERRVQRFYMASTPLGETRPDYAIAAQIGALLGTPLEARAASLVFAHLAKALPLYAGLSYQKLAEVTDQWPVVGGSDLYYSGTGFINKQGLGVSLPLAETTAIAIPAETPTVRLTAGELRLAPVTRLYDEGVLVKTAHVLDARRATKALHINPQDAAILGVQAGEARAVIAGREYRLPVVLDAQVPVGVALAPRSVGLPVSAPQAIRVAALAAVNE